MEDGLWPAEYDHPYFGGDYVLILVWMEDGLWQVENGFDMLVDES